MSEIYIPYELATPRGTISFNQYELPDYYRLSKVDGIEFPAIRTSTGQLAARDGERVNPAFARGRYPSLAGSIVTADLSRRRQMMDTLAAAFESILREDGVLSWQPTGSPSYHEEVMADAPRLFLRLGDFGSQHASDWSGNLNHGTFNGGITQGVASLITAIEGAADFDGANAYVTVPDKASLDAGDVFTVEAWLRPDATPGAGARYTIASKGDNGLHVTINETRHVELFKQGVGTPIVTSTIALVQGQAHHVVVTKNGASVKIYIDGVDQTGSVTNATVLDTADALHIGRRSTAVNYFNGVLDELAFYATALPAARVAAHRAAGVNELATARRQLTVRGFERLQIGGGEGVRKDFQFVLVGGNPVVVGELQKQLESTRLAIATGAGTWSLGTSGGASNWALGDASAQPAWSLGTGVSPGVVSVVNEGNTDAWPILRIHGQVAGAVRVVNLITGDAVVFASLAVPAGSYAELDTWDETAYLNGQQNQTLLGGLDSALSVFPTVPPGASAFQLYADSYDAGARLDVLFRDSFA